MIQIIRRMEAQYGQQCDECLRQIRPGHVMGYSASPRTVICPECLDTMIGERKAERFDGGLYVVEMEVV